MLLRLDGLEASEQLETTGLMVLTLLEAVRPRFVQSPEDRQVFDLVCSDVATWLRQGIERLRFAKAH